MTKKIQRKSRIADELYDDKGKRHTRMSETRPDPNLLNKNESEIIGILNTKLQEYPLAKLLRDISVVATKCGHDIDGTGHVTETNGEVVITLAAMAHIISLSLTHSSKRNLIFKISDQYITPHRITNTVDECLKPVFPLCLTFNSIQISHQDAFDKKRDKFLQILMPLNNAQERFSITPRQLIARCQAWFAHIPQIHSCPMPIAIDKFIAETYGAGKETLAAAAIGLYAASHKYHIITPETFQNIDNAHTHPAKQLLKYALPISSYNHVTVEEMKSLPDKIQTLPLSTPMLVEFPIIQLGENLWSIPIPRLILNTLVETIHWKIFDHCFKTEERADNSYMNWFGTVFEWYVRNILMSSFTRKMIGEYEYNDHDKAPDLMELHTNRALLVEVKARRPRFDIKQFQSIEAATLVQNFILNDTLDQVLKFLKRHCNDNTGTNPKLGGVKEYIILVVTPEMWPANQYVESGLVKDKISKFISEHPQIKCIRLCYVAVSDIEIIPKLKGHHFAYDLIDSYLTSDFYPSSSLGDFIRLKSILKNMSLSNPYVNEQFKAAFATCKKITFGNIKERHPK